MNLTPRQLAVRLALWCVLLGWAVWKLRGEAGDTALAPRVRPLARPSDIPAHATPAPIPPVVDPLLLLDALSSARAAADACAVRGAILAVRVGPGGLESADLEGQITDDAATCYAAKVWGLVWPAGLEPTTTSLEIPAGEPPT